MEKVHKPLTAVGSKRPRKISQSAAVIEPKKKKNKTEMKNKSEMIIMKNTIPEHFKTDTSKISTIDNIQDIQPHMSQKKKKAKKPKDGQKSGLINTSPKVNTAEIKKPKKRQAGSLLANSPITASPLKKKKKRKQLLAELNVLKESIIGPNSNKPEITDEKSPESPKKVKLKTADTKLESKQVTLPAADKYPVLSDKELIDKFMGIPLTNNQKGRIRETIKLQLQGSEKTMFPDIINGKIQAILNGVPDLTGHHLRRIRVLYNMLKTSLTKPDELTEVKEKKKNKKKDSKDSKEGKEVGKDVKKKGPKRYVVFLGNLPLDVNKDKIMDHFRELNEHIVDIRLPPVKEGVKSAIAYVELSNEPTYELALSKHHSMLGNKRIKVLYTTQKNSKITRGEAKGKSAKLIALQKAGKLVGSIPAKKKRSHRRAIAKQAKKEEEAKLAALIQ